MSLRAARKGVVTAVLLSAAALHGEGTLIDGMEQANFRAPQEKASHEIVDGRFGKAVKFSFADGCRNAFFMLRARGAPEWDNAAGFSFWVKGDGSDRFGGLQFVWNEDYALRYAYAFPIDDTEWRKVVVPWRDIFPETAKPGAKLIDPKDGNAPSRLGQLWFGKWWYWRDYGPHSYAIDEIRLEPVIELDNNDYRPRGAPLERVLAKLRARKPVTMVTMGDSLTDYNHWANRQTNWPTLLAAALKQQYGGEVTIVNPAMGGTELRNNIVLIPRWAKKTPEPDLVTVCFGYNDWGSGMRGQMFHETLKEAVDRIRRATGGKADVLIITTCPAVERWDEMAELAQACRDAAKEKNAGIADIYSAFHEAGRTDRERLYCSDKTHLGPAGHEIVAKTVLDAIARGGR
ncbi:MAG TPA: hypothetical protein ENN09_06495 [Planctomycetes bacterium]|nr:hypothetical protein [Planctomycetota bacterium]